MEKITLKSFADLAIFENALEEGRYDLTEECVTALEELSDLVTDAYDNGNAEQGAYYFALWCTADKIRCEHTA